MTTISALANTVAVGLCGFAAAGEPYETFRGQCMGTTYSVKIADRPAELALGSIEILVRDELERIEQIFSLFRSSSELSCFNAAPGTKWIEVSVDLHAVAARALELSEQTGGALDPTVGPLVRLWRSGATSGDWTPPSASAIAAARRHVGCGLIEMRSQPPAMQKRSSGVELDLNALVEGWAIDRVARLLSERGIHHTLIELGGEFCGVGCRGDGQPWQIGIEDPRQTKPGCYATAKLGDAALATSGDYRHANSYQGRSYSHILDPRTGYPIRHDVAAVSVVASDAFTADGWSTALLVLGPIEGIKLAERHGLAASFVRRAPNSCPHLTPAAAKRMVLLHDAELRPSQHSQASRWSPFCALGVSVGGAVGAVVFYLLALNCIKRGPADNGLVRQRRNTSCRESTT